MGGNCFCVFAGLLKLRRDNCGKPITIPNMPHLCVAELLLLRRRLIRLILSDIVEAASLLHGEEQFVHGYAGYQGLDKRSEMPSESAPVCVIAMRPGKLAQLTQDDCEQAQLLRQAARELASRRAKVEYVFRDIKIRFGYAKNRYRCLVTNAASLTFLTAIANVLRGDAYERRSLIASEI